MELLLGTLILAVSLLLARHGTRQPRLQLQPVRVAVRSQRPPRS